LSSGLNKKLSAPASFNNNNNNDDDTPRCKGHNLPCVLRTVTKEGKNQGRQFYVCPKPQEEQLKECFMWADELNSGGNNTNSVSSFGSSASSSGGGACYNCGQPGHWSSNCTQPKKGFVCDFWREKSNF
jgi:DNA topoisomerase-3